MPLIIVPNYIMYCILLHMIKYKYYDKIESYSYMEQVETKYSRFAFKKVNTNQNSYLNENNRL